MAFCSYNNQYSYVAVLSRSLSLCFPLRYCIQSACSAELPLKGGAHMQGRRQWYGWYMAVPVFEEEKMASLGFLTYAYAIEWPLRAVCRSLGHLRGLLHTFSSIQSSDVRIEASQFSVYIAILVREARRKLGRG